MSEPPEIERKTTQRAIIFPDIRPLYTLHARFPPHSRHAAAYRPPSFPRLFRYFIKSWVYFGNIFIWDGIFISLLLQFGLVSNKFEFIRMGIIRSYSRFAADSLHNIEDLRCHDAFLYPPRCRWAAFSPSIFIVLTISLPLPFITLSILFTLLFQSIIAIILPRCRNAVSAAGILYFQGYFSHLSPSKCTHWE